MYNILPLLLLTAAPVNTELIQLCREIRIETQIAVEAGIINEQVADDILQGCLELE